MTAFFDSNVLIYGLQDDPTRAVNANRLIAAGGWISVQVLNEVANVLRGKLRHGWSDIERALLAYHSSLAILPLTLAIHQRGLAPAKRHRVSIYDAMIVAAALEAGCDTLYSEDMHHGLVVDGRLSVVNSFA